MNIFVIDRLHPETFIMVFNDYLAVLSNQYLCTVRCRSHVGAPTSRVRPDTPHADPTGTCPARSPSRRPVPPPGPGQTRPDAFYFHYYTVSLLFISNRLHNTLHRTYRWIHLYVYCSVAALSHSTSPPTLPRSTVASSSTVHHPLHANGRLVRHANPAISSFY